MDIDALASSWIEETRNYDESAKENPPAIEAAIMLGIDDPETLWQFLLSIFSRENVGDILSSVGAGPLEDLISGHGELFIDRIRAEVPGNTNLVESLKWVWVAEDVKPSVESFTELGCSFVSAKAT